MVCLLACEAPSHAPVDPGAERGDRVETPATIEEIVLEGRFAGAQTGDYHHLFMARAMGPDCEFWGYGDELGGRPVDVAAIERLETEESLLGGHLRVVFTIDTVPVPELGGAVPLALPVTVSFPGLDGWHADGVEAMRLDAEVESVRSAAHAYVDEVAAVDLPLEILDVGLRGDEGFAVALYAEHPDPTWQRSYVALRRDAVDGWVAANYGTMLDPPSWYLCAAPDPAEPPPRIESWLGTWIWEEPGFRHGGEDGDAMSSGWTWTLELERRGLTILGRLTIDGWQTAEEYIVRLQGSVDHPHFVLVDAVAARGPGLEPGMDLFRLSRSGHQVLTRFDALAPLGAPAPDPSTGLESAGWAVRFRR
ncbi:MAG: DUF5991 domain-containing protein [Acidobacteriota bacterium]